MSRAMALVLLFPRFSELFSAVEVISFPAKVIGPSQLDRFESYHNQLFTTAGTERILTDSGMTGKFDRLVARWTDRCRHRVSPQIRYWIHYGALALRHAGHYRLLVCKNRDGSQIG